MKFLSIITPSHNPKYLNELEKCILSQTYTNWEWIIALNNGAQYKSNDYRIKCLQVPFKSTSIGALKKWACEQCTGEIIVEVDHDDLITPNCLEEIEQAFKEDKIGFVYSDNAKLGEFKPYNPIYGWTHKTFEWNNQKLISMNSQPLLPGRLGYIWFAPDHVRAWRKSVYDMIGGHDSKLEVLDDLDLMHRLYMNTEFKYIPKVLYIYRIDGSNTWLERNKIIQTRTVEIFKQNIYNLAFRWAKLNKLLLIDLCGGINKPEGYISIDKEEGDIIYDLDKGIPLKDNSVGVIRAHDALEHIKDKQLIMQEIHRVLAPGGLLLSITPSTDGRGAFQDPTHVSFWNTNSFWYWTRPEQMKYIRNEKYKFRECLMDNIYLNDFNKKNNIIHAVAYLEKI